MYCPNCNTQNANDAKFCTSCGNSLIRNTQDLHEVKKIQMRRKEAEQKERVKKLLPLIIAFIGILLIICIVMALREESLMIHTPSYSLQPFTLNAVPIFFIGKFGPQKLSKSDKELLKILVTPLLWVCFPIIPIFKLLKLLFKH